MTSNWDEYDDIHLMITTKYLSEEKLKSLFKELVQYIGLVEPDGLVMEQVYSVITEAQAVIPGSVKKY